jgi:hypothetical protein
MATPRGTTYLLHFARPISPRHPCQHYLGRAADLHARLAVHAAGRGARLTQVALARGIGWRLIRTWEGETCTDERRHKTGSHGARLCPECRGRQSRTRGQEGRVRA